MGSSVRTHFRELAGLPTTLREDYYSGRGVPADVRDELESLLSFDEDESGGITGVVGAAAERFLISNAPVSESGLCGPYRLIRMLGNGGMGAVYLAERADGEIQQRVAIKFIHTGASQPALRERFLQERQILATLNHPGIARLLDAGHSAGHPYLVMEWVDGTRIDEYARNLDDREIAALMVRVAEAVSYAHRNLVVHRDLKPSNILVNAQGQPKLLDFGIAKILDANDATRTVFGAMTPEYASPEQLRGEVQATPTDIYSLGAILRKLLSGRTITEDLAAITGKAMRDEPEERYASADLLIEDLRAFLEYRPVQARRGSAFYYSRKFMRRRWFTIAAGLFAVAGLAGGLLVANHEREIAQRRFQQVRQLSKQFLDLDPEIQRLPGATKVRSRIVSASLEYLERLAAEARDDRDLRLELGTAYVQVARVQGVPVGLNLGQFQQANKSLAKADALVEPLLEARDFPGRRTALLLSAEIARDLMILAQSDDRVPKTRLFARRAVSRLEEFLSMPGMTRAELSAAAKVYVNVALALSNIHDVEDAAGYARKAVELARAAGDERQLGRALGVLSNTARYSGQLEDALRAIRESGALAAKLADPDSIDSNLQRAAAIWREGLILGEAGNINLGRPAEALPLLRKAFEMTEALAKRDPHDYTSRSYVAMTGRELGDLLLTTDPAAALAVFEITERRCVETPDNPKARREEIWALRGAAYALRQLGRPDEAKRKLDRAMAHLKTLKLYPAPTVEPGEEAGTTLRALAAHHAGTGDPAAAIRILEDLLTRANAGNPRPETDLRDANILSRIYEELATIYERTGQRSRAAALRQQRLEIWRHWDRKLPANPFVRPQLELAQRDFLR